MPDAPLLDVRGLSVTLHTTTDSVCVVKDVSWSVHPGRTVALVGESGCGKTISALSLIRLLPAGVTAETEGQALLDGVDLLAMSEPRLRAIRGRDVGMVFQDPLTAFNPARRIGPQIGESLLVHRMVGKREAKRRVLELLDEVGIADPHARYDLYPHELSGGMRQRALVAMAIAAEPRVLIADEPTTALDVTMQAQVLDLLQRLQQTRNMALVLITHDVGVVAGMADTVAVIYAGRVVEYGPAATVLTGPDHPYTRGLLASVPDPAVPRGTPFDSLPGLPPDLATLAPGCVFLERCAHARPGCRAPQSPRPLPDTEHLSACSVPAAERADTGVTV